MQELINGLRNDLSYFDFHNKNLTKEQENKIENIKDIVEKLNNINVYYEAAKCEVISAMEDIMNDDLYKGEEEKLMNISEEEISNMAWRVEDYYGVWDDVYEVARGEVLEKIGD